MSNITIIRLKIILLFTIIGFVTGGIYSGISYGFTAMGVIQGAMTGALIAFATLNFELFIAEKYSSRFAFITVLLIRTISYVLISSLSIIFIAFLVEDKVTLDATFSGPFFVALTFPIAVSFLFNFLLMVNRLMGRKTLINLVIGKYHKPVLEERIFMFLDVNDSTTIAERIGSAKFHSFLNDFFISITNPIIECWGEIYRYVGDEVIISWEMKSGLKDANCIKCFFEIRKLLKRLEKRFLRKHGFIPEFKAGMHYGTVTTGEVGDYKKEIVFLGDVVNTTARIRSECGTRGKSFIVSASLLNLVCIPDNIKAESLGIVKLKGKEEEMELFSLEEK